MKSIFFKRTQTAYLPEITAYKKYLSRFYPHVRAFDSAELSDCDVGEFDCVWRFMGIDPVRKARYLVHDYMSLSTGRYAAPKNVIKKAINTRPDKRIFLNDAVRREFHFSDSVPYSLRDMGIDTTFFQKPAPESVRPYDFVYAGSLNRGKIVTDILDRFTGPLLPLRILLVGEADPALKARYKDFPNIVFFGKVRYDDVPALMMQARYGLNIMPDIYPYNLQTATKVLEYCALGLSVISTPYRWVENFAKEREAEFFWLNPGLENMTIDALENFSFRTPPVEDLEWNKLLSRSGVFDFLGPETA